MGDGPADHTSGELSMPIRPEHGDGNRGSVYVGEVSSIRSAATQGLTGFTGRESSARSPAARFPGAASGPTHRPVSVLLLSWSHTVPESSRLTGPYFPSAPASHHR